MRFCVLGSGSKGNSTLVGSGGAVLLVDAGFSCVETFRRMAAVGVRPEALTAILLTHEHTDHAAGVGVLARKTGAPVYANAATWEAAASRIGPVAEVRHFDTGRSFAVNDLEIHPFSVSHDAADPVGFVIGDGRWRVGYCTDTGCVTGLIASRLSGCHGLVLEANHDPEMLENGPYPLHVQQRVRSRHGHLDNAACAALLAGLLHNDLRHVVLAHLSTTNNLPALAHREARRAAGPAVHGGTRLSFAYQNRPGRMLFLRESSAKGKR